MKFFFPDSLDLVDPNFDFVRETWDINRNRQRDDRYAHEIFERPPFDGILVSKGIVDGCDTGSRYTQAQRFRLDREGLRGFFRIDNERYAHLQTMGDCGAFTYAKQETPPYTAEEVADFYQHLGFDIGIAPDHIVFGFDSKLDQTLPNLDCVPQDFIRRQAITIDLAAEFFEVCKDRGNPFEPMAVGHGWSPKSYADCVEKHQEAGYTRIALGGLVPLKTPEIASIVDAVSEIRNPDVELHLLGVTRLSHHEEFASKGVTSFDSTSPLRKAFMDDWDNYFADGRTYPAIRVPQSEKNNKLKKLIQKGEVDSTEIRHAERDCLQRLLAYGDKKCSLEDTFQSLTHFSTLCGLGSNYFEAYREILENRPWEACDCTVCKSIGINVMIFRGAERNRRRGFHNLFVFHQQFQETAGRS